MKNSSLLVILFKISPFVIIISLGYIGWTFKKSMDISKNISEIKNRVLGLEELSNLQITKGQLQKSVNVLKTSEEIQESIRLQQNISIFQESIKVLGYDLSYNLEEVYQFVRRFQDWGAAKNLYWSEEQCLAFIDKMNSFSPMPKSFPEIKFETHSPNNSATKQVAGCSYNGTQINKVIRLNVADFTDGKTYILTEDLELLLIVSYLNSNQLEPKLQRIMLEYAEERFPIERENRQPLYPIKNETGELFIFHNRFFGEGRVKSFYTLPPDDSGAVFDLGRGKYVKSNTLCSEVGVGQICIPCREIEYKGEKGLRIPFIN